MFEIIIRISKGAAFLLTLAAIVCSIVFGLSRLGEAYPRAAGWSFGTILFLFLSYVFGELWEVR